MSAERSRFCCRCRSAAPTTIAVPEGMAVAPGAFVAVPLGSRDGLGRGLGPARATRACRAKLKDVDRVDRRAAAAGRVAPLRRLGRRLYRLSPPGAVLRMVVSVPAALEPTRPRARLSGGAVGVVRRARLKLTPARRRVLAVLADGPPRPAAELAREAGVGQGVVKGLVDAGAARGGRDAPASFADARCRPAGPDAVARPGARGGRAAPARRRRLLRHPARRRHRRRARPRSISRRSPRRSPPAARCWCCCPRSRSPRNGSTASPRASARRRRRGIRTCPRRCGGAPGARSPRARRASWSARARRCSCRSPISA